jgi:hypothetical protein
MNIQLEPLRDLSLDVATAEQVVGGKGTREVRVVGVIHRPLRIARPTGIAVAVSSAGLGMGPDPGYPNTDSLDDGC